MGIGTPEEKALVDRAKTDAEAFGQLYDLYYQKIFGYILRRVANVAVAEDITSETFFKALKGINSFEWRDISFSSWIFRIASNEIINFYRKNKHVDTVDIDVIAQHPSNQADVREELMQAEAEVARHADYVRVQQCIERLSPNYQEVLALRFFEKKGKESRHIVHL